MMKGINKSAAKCIPRECSRPRVGIPRALLYYDYIPLWKHFFEALGAEVIVSEATSKSTIDLGVKQTVDEACFPVKVYVGHVLSLLGRVDYLFMPRLVSVEEKSYICPKFLGLPDMVRSSVKELPSLISPDINLYKGKKLLRKNIWEVGKIFSSNPLQVYLAYQEAYHAYREYHKLLLKGTLPDDALVNLQQSKINVRLKGGAVVDDDTAAASGFHCLTVALISHPYNLYDDQLNMSILARLKNMGVRVLTPENVNPAVIKEQADKLPKKLFWSMGSKLIGAAFHYMDSPQIDGIIHLTAFGCGPDSFTEELIEREIRRRGSKYFLNLTIDEHTGEAGIVTRLEAFIDMMQRRVASE